MQIEVFRFNDIAVNTYILSDNGKCAIVDPGCHTEKEQQTLCNHIDSKGYQPQFIINTHCHCDHIVGAQFVKEHYNIPFIANPADQYWLDHAAETGNHWGWYDVVAPVIDKPSNDGDTFKLGNAELKVMHTPGHSRGQQAIYSEKDKFVIVGDTIFKGTIGRTDLADGNLDDLMDSIKNKIIPLGGDYTIFPGHGPITKISIEVRENPFLSFFGEDISMENM